MFNSYAYPGFLTLWYTYINFKYLVFALHTVPTLSMITALHCNDNSVYIHILCVSTQVINVRCSFFVNLMLLISEQQLSWNVLLGVLRSRVAVNRDVYQRCRDTFELSSSHAESTVVHVL